MSKTFKVVCIDDWAVDVRLTVGKVYDVGHSNCHWFSVAKDDTENLEVEYYKSRFLRLPTEPKTCDDMTMEEYLAMVCITTTDESRIQVASSYGTPKWKAGQQNGKMLEKFSTQCLYRIKPEKSAKDVEIERIEKEMRKLAEDLAKIKEK